MLHPRIEKIFNHLSKGDIRIAIDEMNKILKGSSKLDELVVQSARYNDLMKQIRLGFLSNEEIDRNKNRLRYALIDMLREVEMAIEDNPKLRHEVEQPLSAKHRTININQSHFGSGDNVAGDKNN